MAASTTNRDQSFKKYGQSKVALYNGIRLNTENDFTYYFESISNLKVPIGSNVMIHWGSQAVRGEYYRQMARAFLLFWKRRLVRMSQKHIYPMILGSY